MNKDRLIEKYWRKMRESSKDEGTYTYGVTPGQFKRIIRQLLEEVKSKDLEKK